MNVPETFFSVNEELCLFGLSCIFGAVTGVFYDVLRTARLLVTHSTMLVFIEDILFLCLYGVFLLSFSSAAARGELRFYYVIGNALGFFLYLATVGSIVIGIMKKIIGLLRLLLNVVISPFRACYVFLSKKIDGKFVGYLQIAVKRFKKIKLLLPKSLIVLYNKRENKKEGP